MTFRTADLRPVNPIWFRFRHTAAVWGLANSLLLRTIRSRQRSLLRKVPCSEIDLESHGVMLHLNLVDTSDFLFYQAILAGGYEEGLVATASRIIRKGDTCVDIGANRGYFTLLFSRLTGPSGRVHAFEPGPGALSKLRKNLEINERSRAKSAQIVIHPIAASDREGRVNFYASPIEIGRDSTQRHDSAVGMEVVSRKLDDELCSESHIRLVKIDAEGAEWQILRGMRETIEHNRDLIAIVEWNRSYATYGLWNELSSRFEVYRIVERTAGTPLEHVSSPTQLHGIQNLLCVQDRTVLPWLT
jgi:FkbM family methyltransferase